MKISLICFILIFVILTTAACSEQSAQTSSSAFSDASTSKPFFEAQSKEEESSAPDNETTEESSAPDNETTEESSVPENESAEESSAPADESLEEDSMTNEHCLIVFGKSFPQNDLIHVYYEGQSINAKLPVVVILEALGAEIKQSSASVVKFRITTPTIFLTYRRLLLSKRDITII